MAGSLSQRFNHAFKGNIFRMLLDGLRSVMVLEIREEESHQVSFAAIDMVVGALLWKDLTFDEPWRCGLETVDDGIAYFYLSENENDPARHGIAAVDLSAGTEIWKRQDLQLQHVHNRNLLVRQTGQEQLFNYEPNTDVLTPQEGHHGPDSTQQNSSLLFPHHYRQGSTHFETASRFVAAKTGEVATGAIDYLEHAEYILLSYYSGEKGNICNLLSVLDTNGTEIERFTLDSGLSAVGTDTFIIIGDTLIFIRNKNEINAYSL